MKFCKKCVLPDTCPGIKLDEQGICSPCRYHEIRQKVDWTVREKELKQIVEWAKQNSTTYDCVVGVSGGKDSTFQALYSRNELGLNCLLANCVPDEITEIGRHNINNLQEMGFDCLMFKPNPKVCKMVVKQSFYKYGNLVKPSEYPLYAVPVRVAINYKIPLVVMGENPLEMGDSEDVGDTGDASKIALCNTLAGGNASDWVNDKVKMKDVFPYQFPSQEEIKKAKIKIIYLGHYDKEWSPFRNAEFSMAHGLKVRKGDLHECGRYLPFSALDSDATYINQMLKYIKYGYGTATNEASYEIRNGRLTRQEAIKLVKEYDGKCDVKYIKQFCDYIDINLDEFWRVANSFRGDMWIKGRNHKWVLKDTLWQQIL